MFKAYISEACLDAGKIIEIQMISFSSYEGYEMLRLHSFNFPKCKFALGVLRSTKGNLSKRPKRKRKEGSMPDEQLKSVLKNKASAVIHVHITYYLYFALISMET